MYNSMCAGPPCVFKIQCSYSEVLSQTKELSIYYSMARPPIFVTLFLCHKYPVAMPILNW